VSRAEPSSADFERDIDQILQSIQKRQFEKVVPIVCEDLEFAAPLEAAMLHTDPKPGRYAYGFEFEGEGMSGLTPEILFEVEDGFLKTMALAGTGPDGGPSLLKDKKEMHEHSLVIQHISEELSGFGQVSVGKTSERAYGKLKHLHTPIEVDLDRTPEFMELIVRLHPTAALGGWPRKPAVEWLERQPFHYIRKRFGAPFGFQEDDRMFCVVAIRGIQWWGTRARISTGCGVVEESSALREWNELKLKREAIYQSFGVDL
jgi:menaquinone-specific isochorismate synthase